MNVQQITSWAISAGGRPIDLYHSSASQWQDINRPIVLIGGVHGDEPEGVALANAMLDWLKSPCGHSQVPWILIPCLNPDGYSQDQRVNAHGVDLNRNYPSKNWSPEFELKKYYPGPHAGSEPEIRALVEVITQTRPRLLIHCHSWKPCIVCTGDWGRQDALHLKQSSSYEIVNSIGYPTPGSLSQYGWHENQIPVICIEEAEKESPEKTWARFGPGLIAIFNDTSERCE